MSEAERIADQHRRAFDGEAWHGPHVFDLLEGIDAEHAARKPLPQAHSIWEIVLHIRAWEGVVLRRIRGDVVELQSEEDWPPVTDTSPAAWLQARAALRETHDELNREIAPLSDARLFDAASGKNYSLYILIQGAVQHALYHAGQIAILRKS